MKERENECETNGSEIIKINKCIYKVCKSICKIIVEKSIGSGFLIKLYRGNKPFYCLMTNEHVIKKEMIELKETIEIYYDNEYERREIKLDKEERYIKEYKI